MCLNFPIKAYADPIPFCGLASSYVMEEGKSKSDFVKGKGKRGEVGAPPDMIQDAVKGSTPDSTMKGKMGLEAMKGKMADMMVKGKGKGKGKFMMEKGKCKAGELYTTKGDMTSKGEVAKGDATSKGDFDKEKGKLVEFKGKGKLVEFEASTCKGKGPTQKMDGDGQVYAC